MFYSDWKPHSYSIFSEMNSDMIWSIFFCWNLLEDPSLGITSHRACNVLMFMRSYRCITEEMSESARTVNISSELVLMHGARHGFRDSGARVCMASSPPPSPVHHHRHFYYYWANITQAPLIIHQHLSAKSHAEEILQPGREKISPMYYCEHHLILSVHKRALITNCLYIRMEYY